MQRGECSDDNYDIRKQEMTSVCCRDANAVSSCEICIIHDSSREKQRKSKGEAQFDAVVRSKFTGDTSIPALD